MKYVPGEEPFEPLRLLVWEKGKTIPGRDRDFWREDQSRQLMCWAHYGKRSEPEGWVFARINPYGPDEADNLQPVHVKTKDGLDKVPPPAG